MLDPTHYFPKEYFESDQQPKPGKVRYRKQTIEGTACTLYTLSIPWAEAVALRSTRGGRKSRCRLPYSAQT